MGRNPIAGSAELHMLLDMDEFLCDARRPECSRHVFRKRRPLSRRPLHIFSAVAIAMSPGPGQTHAPVLIVLLTLCHAETRSLPFRCIVHAMG